MRCTFIGSRESGETGRRTRLRIWRRKAWGFESPLSHVRGDKTVGPTVRKGRHGNTDEAKAFIDERLRFVRFRLRSNLARMTHPDAAHCLRIVRSHARTFWLASCFLQPEKRRAAFALYAFCRVADDMVDLATGERAAEVPALLADYRCRLGEALAGEPEGPVL